MCAIWCNFGGLLELRLYRQAATWTSRLFTVFLQSCSECSLKYCFWSMKHFLVSFLFLRKTCCTFLFFCKKQLESRSLSFINWAEGKKSWDWFFSLSPARPKLVDIQSCKTNLLIQFFLRVFWSGHIRWCNFVCICEECSADASCRWFSALYYKSVWRLIDRFPTKMQEMQFLERDLTMHGLRG